MSIQNYIAITRPDRWYKNIFVLLGVIIAVRFSHTPFCEFAGSFFWGLASVYFLASANYVINELLDVESDKFHPLKNNRHLLIQNMNAVFIRIEYVVLLTAGFYFALHVSRYFWVTTIAFGVTGILYNMKPFRTKDKVYWDIISDAFTSPLRVMLGWFIVIKYSFPPTSLLLGFWMAASFFMGIKRYAEFRSFGKSENLKLYRYSFKFYTEQDLLLFSIFYGIFTMFFLGVFFLKYHRSLFVTLPFLIVLFVWYIHIGMKPNSLAQNPERIYHEAPFFIYCLFFCVLVTGLLFAL